MYLILYVFLLMSLILYFSYLFLHFIYFFMALLLYLALCFCNCFFFFIVLSLRFLFDNSFYVSFFNVIFMFLYVSNLPSFRFLLSLSLPTFPLFFPFSPLFSTSSLTPFSYIPLYQFFSSLSLLSLAPLLSLPFHKFPSINSFLPFLSSL